MTSSGVVSGPVDSGVTSHVQQVVFGVPLPLEPAADLPSADVLVGILAGLADANIPFENKGNLIEGGVSPTEASLADRKVQQAVDSGDWPITFNVSDIQPAEPGAATASVTGSSPKSPPQTLKVKFVNQGGWKLTHRSALNLLQAIS